MKLTKAEIQYIDNYLIKNEVKFWDVRLELLDHIVSAVEDKIKNDGISFNEALLEVHRGFGNQLIKGSIPQSQIWTKGLYQSNIGFKKFVRTKQKEIGRKQRHRFWKSFPKFLVSKAFLLEFSVLLAIIFTVYALNPKIAAIVAYIGCYLPEFSKIVYGVFDKSSRSSLQMQMSLNLSGLYMPLSYFVISGFGSYYEGVEEKPYIYIVCLFVFTFLFMRHGFNIYRKVLKENKRQYNLIKQ